MDSIFLSSLDISALMMTGFLTRFLFDKIVLTSILRRNFTKMGLGRVWQFHVFHGSVTVQLKGNVASIHMRVMLASSHGIILLQCTVEYRVDMH